VPSEGAEEVLAHARAVRDAPTLEAGEAQAASLIESFGSVYPAAVKSFADDLEASLVHLWSCRCVTASQCEDDQPPWEKFPRGATKDEGDPAPPRWEERHEAGICHADEGFWEVEQGVSVSELERKRLKLLRRELGIDPPPDKERREPKREANEVVAWEYLGRYAFTGAWRLDPNPPGASS
jgi:hypothetical protein